jgi:pentatricopeptide repeat protein
VTYGCILEACVKTNKMQNALKIYDSLRDSKVNMNTIVYTTMIKGFINQEMFEEAMMFFEGVKDNVELPGMIITYNCVLDLYVKKNDVKGANELFKEIERVYGADIISYSTIIKGLCYAEKKFEAFEYIKRMLNSGVEEDITVINLFLDSCSNANDFKLGISVY